MLVEPVALHADATNTKPTDTANRLDRPAPNIANPLTVPLNPQPGR
ncbi:MAG: hypothetical protein OXG55_16985 [bacterium]|nr:hypothetical protein [bacterium]MCY3953550.1 hypothetical protein [bacterium]MCY4104934.1 hypothetical protein [bacterium]